MSISNDPDSVSLNLYLCPNCGARGEIGYRYRISNLKERDGSIFAYGADVKLFCELCNRECVNDDGNPFKSVKEFEQYLRGKKKTSTDLMLTQKMLKNMNIEIPFCATEIHPCIEGWSFIPVQWVNLKSYQLTEDALSMLGTTTTEQYKPVPGEWSNNGKVIVIDWGWPEWLKPGAWVIDRYGKAKWIMYVAKYVYAYTEKGVEQLKDCMLHRAFVTAWNSATAPAVVKVVSCLLNKRSYYSYTLEHRCGYYQYNGMAVDDEPCYFQQLGDLHALPNGRPCGTVSKAVTGGFVEIDSEGVRCN